MDYDRLGHDRGASEEWHGWPPWATLGHWRSAIAVLLILAAAALLLVGIRDFFTKR